MVEIDVRRSEGETLSPTDLATAVRAMQEDGFVVLKNAVDIAHLDILHTRMIEDLEALQRREDAPYNWNVGNIQQDPPPFPPYLFRDVLVNEYAIAVTHALLGTPVKNSLYSGNTCLKSDQRQPVHADISHLWPDMEVAHPPAQIVVNIPTVDVFPENGSTEIWPGTHRDVAISAGKDIKIPANKLEEQRRLVPPFQPTMSKGSILLRDMRLWHAGMPNRTDRPRPMIAMIHNAGWLETGLPLRFPAGTESLFEHPILQTCARFIDEPIDHINAPHGYEYSK